MREFAREEIFLTSATLNTVKLDKENYIKKPKNGKDIEFIDISTFNGKNTFTKVAKEQNQVQGV